MAEVRLKGLGVALVTPFNEDLSIDYPSLERLIEHVIEGGCDYIVALGTTAETPTLSKDEKREITSFIRLKTAGRVPLVIGIGGNNTQGVIQEIKETDTSGFCAILSVTPYYNKPNQEGLYRHYEAISKESQLPIVLYNVPKRTGVNLSAKTTIRLASDFPNICAVKEASGDLNQAEEIAKNTAESFLVISGDDGNACEMMQCGGVGLISVLANAFTDKVRDMIHHCEAGKPEYALSLKKELEPIISHIFEEGNPAGIKSALSHLGLIKNYLRLPLIPVSEPVDSKIKKACQQLLSE